MNIYIYIYIYIYACIYFYVFIFDLILCNLRTINNSTVLFLASFAICRPFPVVEEYVSLYKNILPQSAGAAEHTDCISE